MKYLLLFLLSLNAFAQDTITDIETVPSYAKDHKLASIEVAGSNIVYRGIENKITLSVTGAEAWNTRIIARGGTLKKLWQVGQYTWNVSAIKEDTVKISVIYNLANGERRTEEKEFEVRNLPNPVTTIDNQGCDICIIDITLADLENAVVGIKFEDVLAEPFRNVTVKKFTIRLPDDKEITITGNRFTPEALQKIKKLKTGSLIVITQPIFDLPRIYGVFDIKTHARIRLKEELSNPK